MRTVAFLAFVGLAPSALGQIDIEPFPSGTPGCVDFCLNAQINEITSLAPGATTNAEICASPAFIASFNGCLLDSCGTQYATALQMASSFCPSLSSSGAGISSSGAASVSSTATADQSSRAAASSVSLSMSSGDLSTLNLTAAPSDNSVSGASTSTQFASAMSDSSIFCTSTSMPSASPSSAATGGVTGTTPSTAAPVNMTSQSAGPVNASATATQSSNSQSARPSVLAIVGCVVGGVGVSAVVILLLLLLMRRRRLQRKHARFIVDGRSISPTLEMTEAHPYLDEPSPTKAYPRDTPKVSFPVPLSPVGAIVPPFPVRSSRAAPSVTAPVSTSRNEKRRLPNPPATSDRDEVPHLSHAARAGQSSMSLQKASTADLVEALIQRVRRVQKRKLDDDTAEPPSYSAS